MYVISTTYFVLSLCYHDLNICLTSLNGVIHTYLMAICSPVVLIVTLNLNFKFESVDLSESRYFSAHHTTAALLS